MSYKINNVYYLTYVYRFCSQFCSQNNFTVFKAEPTTIRKIHLCSYIIKKIKQTLEQLMEQIRLARHKRFGASSEKNTEAEQLSIFNEELLVCEYSKWGYRQCGYVQLNYDRLRKQA